MKKLDFSLSSDGTEWLSFVPESDVEISIPASGAQALLTESTEVAEHVAASLQQLFESAVRYLNAFVNDESARHVGRSVVIGVVCAPSGESVRVDLHSEEDTYGCWWVEFAVNPYGKHRFSAMAFGRRSI